MRAPGDAGAGLLAQLQEANQLKDSATALLRRCGALAAGAAATTAKSPHPRSGVCCVAGVRVKLVCGMVAEAIAAVRAAR